MGAAAEPAKEPFRGALAELSRAQGIYNSADLEKYWNKSVKKAAKAFLCKKQIIWFSTGDEEGNLNL